MLLIFYFCHIPGNHDGYSNESCEGRRKDENELPGWKVMDESEVVAKEEDTIDPRLAKLKDYFKGSGIRR